MRSCSLLTRMWEIKEHNHGNNTRFGDVISAMTISRISHQRLLPKGTHIPLITQKMIRLWFFISIHKFSFVALSFLCELKVVAIMLFIPVLKSFTIVLWVGCMSCEVLCWLNKQRYTNWDYSSQNLVVSCKIQICCPKPCWHFISYPIHIKML